MTMELVSATTRKEGSYIVCLEVKGVALEDLKALVDGTGHVEVILHSADETTKLCVAARSKPATLHFDESKA